MKPLTELERTRVHLGLVASQWVDAESRAASARAELVQMKFNLILSENAPVRDGCTYDWKSGTWTQTKTGQRFGADGQPIKASSA